MAGDYAAAHAQRVADGDAKKKDDGNRSHMEIELDPIPQKVSPPPRHKQQTVDDKSIVPDTGVQRYYNGHNDQLQTT